MNQNENYTQASQVAAQANEKSQSSNQENTFGNTHSENPNSHVVSEHQKTQNESSESNLTVSNNNLVEFDQSKPTVIKLSKPVVFEGQTYHELVCYFDDLTGNDMDAIGKEVASAGHMVINPGISTPFLAAFAARAARVPTTLVASLKAKDYQKATNAAQIFLGE